MAIKHYLALMNINSDAKETLKCITVNVQKSKIKF